VIKNGSEIMKFRDNFLEAVTKNAVRLERQRKGVDSFD
jgi:hypothetical protein